VVDDGRKVDLAQLCLDREKVVAEAEYFDEPAELAHAGEAAPKAVEARSQPEIATEIEACAARPDAVEARKLGVVDAVIDNGDAAILLPRRLLSTSCINR
jgi:hypothetical protein